MHSLGLPTLVRSQRASGILKLEGGNDKSQIWRGQSERGPIEVTPESSGGNANGGPGGASTGGTGGRGGGGGSTGLV